MARAVEPTVEGPLIVWSTSTPPAPSPVSPSNSSMPGLDTTVAHGDDGGDGGGVKGGKGGGGGEGGGGEGGGGAGGGVGGGGGEYIHALNVLMEPHAWYE